MYLLSLLLATGSAVEGLSIPQHSHSVLPRGIKTKTSSPSPFKAASAFTTASNVLTLKSKNSISSSRKNHRSAGYVLGHSRKSKPTSGFSGLISLYEGEEFAAEVTFGTQTFEFVVDTGSSDTWVVESVFSCVDPDTSEAETQDYCAFGPTFTVDETFAKISGENFNISYSDGEFLTGVMGWENVTVAGISVNQTVGLVNYAAWYGDSTTSGLLGLAYPSLTSAYKGADPSKDTVQVEYSPLFTTMYKQGLIDSLFSLAILRDISGPAGYLALGGLPPIDFVHDFTSTPILITEVSGYAETYDFYTINIDGIVLGKKSLRRSGGDIQYIVDSGTTLNYFPTAVADAINAAFVPPASYSDDDGAYIVNCDAKAPSVGIEISGTTFWTNPLDMIILSGTDDDGNDICISGVNDGGEIEGNSFILGDTFLKNVVAVFDVGAVEMSFAAREFYSSNDPVR